MPPQVTISRIFTSDYGHAAHVDGQGFLPDNQYTIHIFYPSGRPIGGQGRKTDSNGKFQTTIGHWSSAKEERGKYIVYVYPGDFRSGVIDPNTIVQSNNEAIARFDFPSRHDTLLKIDKMADVPWGVSAVVTGTFESKDDKPDGTFPYKQKVIYFTGTYTSLPVYTNELGRFQGILKIPKLVQSSCTIHAHFDDDGHFGTAESNILYYNVIKHDTSLSLSINPLMPKFVDMVETQPTKISLKTGRFYLLSGLLRDKTRDSSVANRVINFEGPEELHLSSVITDTNGNFYLHFRAPYSHGSFSIKADFNEDELYNGSSANIRSEITEDLSSQMPTFKLFRAFNSFISGFQNSKEPPQIRSAMWLLSLLDANPIPLGILDNSGKNEDILENGISLLLSGDIIANFDGVPLIISCTVSVPTTEKIDKIYNTAEYLTKTIRKRFLPLIISNKPAKGMKNQAFDNQVLILDQNDIMDIVDLVLKDQQAAKKLFSNKLKKII